MTKNETNVDAASTTDINELFQRDPLKLDDKNIDQIIDKFRAARKQFLLGNMKAGSTKPKTEKQKVAEEMSSKVEINVADLMK